MYVYIYVFPCWWQKPNCIRQSCQRVFILGGTIKISEFSIFYVHFSFYLHLDNFRERCHQPNRSRLPIVRCNHLKALHEKGIGSFKSSLTSSTKLCAMANRSKWGDQVQNFEAPGLDRTAASWVKKTSRWIASRSSRRGTWLNAWLVLWRCDGTWRAILVFHKGLKVWAHHCKIQQDWLFNWASWTFACVAQVGSRETICRRWTIWLKDSHLNI